MKVYCSICKTFCDGIIAGYGAHPQPEWGPVAESLSRRLDALEKQAGPIGTLYVTDVDHATGTVTYGHYDLARRYVTKVKTEAHGILRGLSEVDRRGFMDDVLEGMCRVCGRDTDKGYFCKDDE